MKKVLLMIVGILLLLLGAAGVAAGALSLSVFGSQGERSEPVAQVRTLSGAIYVRSFNISQTKGPQGVLDISLVAEAGGGKDIFIGVAPPDAVQKFLLGVPYEAAARIENGSFVSKPVPGTKLPAPAPGEQDFWDASSSGRAPSIDWADQAGEDVLVVMNADGSPGVVADLSAAIGSPKLFSLTIGALVAGSVLFILGVLLLVLGIRAGRKGGGASVSA